MKISEYFNRSEFSMDQDFISLGGHNSKNEGTVCYIDQEHMIDEAMKNPNVVGIITSRELAKDNSEVSYIYSDCPRRTFYRLYEKLGEQEQRTNQKPAQIGNDCHIDDSARISPGCVIGNNVTIGANVFIANDVTIGNNVKIDACATIGSDGILYYKDEEDLNCYIVHHGAVVIEDGAYVMSHANIAKSVFKTSPTILGKASLVGIGSVIGHDTRLGRNVIISGNCLLARGVVVEDSSWVGSSVVIREYIHLGEEARVMAGSIVVENVKEKSVVSGNFAMAHSLNIREFIKKKRGSR